MTTAAKSFEIRGVHVLWAMLAFFGAIIAVNVAFAVIAVRSFPGEDVRRSYLQGLQYNETLAQRRVQAQLGWMVSAGFRAAADRPVLELRLTDAAGAPLEGVRVSGDLQWPTDARFDRALTFEPAGDGRYRAAIDDLNPGRWRLRARADGGAARALDFEAELTWQASQ
jgi:nitrogen fixation protein FixH